MQVSVVSDFYRNWLDNFFGLRFPDLLLLGRLGNLLVGYFVCGVYT